MKILYLTSSFVPSIGGIENHTYNLAKEMVKRGHEIYVITSAWDNAEKKWIQPSEEIIEGIKVYRLKPRVIFNYHYTPKMYRLFQKIKPDLVHVQSFRSYQHDMGTLYFQLRKIPTIVNAHGAIPAITISNKLLKWIHFHTIGKFILRKNTHFVAVSNFEVEHYLKLNIPKSKITIIPNAINLDEFKTKTKSKPHEKTKILYMGRLAPVKGIDLLLKAFKELNRDDSTLWIVGKDHGYGPEIEKNLDSNIVLNKSPTRKDVLNAFHTCDIFVLTSLYEIFGITILEASGR